MTRPSNAREMNGYLLKSKHTLRVTRSTLKCTPPVAARACDLLLIAAQSERAKTWLACKTTNGGTDTILTIQHVEKRSCTEFGSVGTPTSHLPEMSFLCHGGHGSQLESFRNQILHRTRATIRCSNANALKSTETCSWSGPAPRRGALTASFCSFPMK